MKNVSASNEPQTYFLYWTYMRSNVFGRICDLHDEGHAHRRIVRKVRSFVSGNEFADEYTPPYFSREFSYSKKERDIKARQLKSDSDRKTTALAPLVTQTLLKKNVSRFFDNKIFAYSKTEHGFEFRSYSPCGDEYKFEFAKYTAKYLCARYETSIKYNGEEIFRHDFAPEAGLNAETGLEHFMCNLEYDLEIFKNVLLPFIDRESAIELELAEQEKKTPRVKARSAVLASENALTDAVSRVSETMSMWYVLSMDMGADCAIGFDGSVDCQKASSFAKDFFEYYATNYGVGNVIAAEAFYYALHQSQSLYSNDYMPYFYNGYTEQKYPIG